MKPVDQQFVELLEANRDRILRFVSVYAHGTADKEDLFQEIVFEIWRALPKFRGDADIRTFVYRVALRVAMRFAQKRNRQIRSRDALEGIRFEAEGDDASLDAIRRERVEALRSAVARLNDVDRLLVTLHLEGMSNTEIAEVAGITSNHVAVRLKRAREKLSIHLRKAS